MSAGIIGIGLNCPLGQGLDTVAAAYRDGTRHFVKSKHGPIGIDGAPITLSSVIPFEDERGLEPRLQRLFAGAAEDLAAMVTADHPVVLRLVVPGWVTSHAIGDRLRGWIAQTYPAQFSRVEFFADGETIALYEVARGLQHVRDGSADRLVVGALDSFMAPELLDLLAAQGRLLSREIPHGVIPGEAAALFMLAQAADAASPPMLGTLISVFNGFEPEDVRSPRGIIGKGLAKPLRQAFENFVPHRFLADLNGERWRSEDIGFALSGARIPDELLADFETPIGSVGDCGAVNSLIMAAISLASGPGAECPNEVGEHADGSVSVISASLWQGLRSVAVVQSFHGRGLQT